jgi:hypothetical protein
MWIALLWFCLGAAVIGGIVGQIKEKGTRDAEGAWFGWGLATGVFALGISIILCLLSGLFAQPIEAGEVRVKEVKTYTVAEKSRMDIDGTLEFTYVDEAGTLQHFNKWIDDIEFQGESRKTVEVTDFQYVKSNILPWDIISDGRSAVVK